MITHTSPTSAPLALALMGPPHIARGGHPLQPRLSDRLQALLAYLAVESDRAHPRSLLAGLFWPDSSEAEALSHLRYALSNLRQAIGDRAVTPPFLCITPATVRFNTASDYALDVATFSKLAALQ